MLQSMCELLWGANGRFDLEPGRDVRQLRCLMTYGAVEGNEFFGPRCQLEWKFKFSEIDISYQQRTFENGI